MKVPHLRWLVAFALFFAALLNYVDRNVLGLLAVTIQKDLNVSNQEYASIVKKPWNLRGKWLAFQD